MRRVWPSLGTALAAGIFVTAALADPKPSEISYYYDCFEHSLPRPVARQLDPSRWVRRAIGRPKEALNVDGQDQVRLPSTWWQPRLGYRPVSVEQLRRGPGPGAGPAPGRWTITKGKSQGVTPGFFMKDRDGTGFIIKFDPPDFPEMATASDVIASHL